MSSVAQESANKPAIPELLPRPELLATVRDGLARTGRIALLDERSPSFGSGKTELARAFVRACASDYARVIWLRAHESAVFVADFVEIAFQTGQASASDHHKSSLVDAAKHHLQSEQSWLIVVDGLRDAALLDEYLNGVCNGHVLVTGRSLELPPQFETIHVPELGETEVAGYLEIAAEELGQLNGHRAALTALREPIVAWMASIHRSRHRAPLVDVARLLSADRSENASPVAPLVETLLSRLKLEDIAAYQLALTCAHLDTTQIAPSLLQNSRTFLPSQLAAVLSDSENVRLALGKLACLGLLRPTPSGAAMASTVAEAILAHLSDDEKQEWAKRSLRLVSDAFPHEEQYHGHLSSCSRLLGVALATTGRCIELGCELDAAGILLNRVGQYLHSFGDSESACQCLERSARIAALQHGYESSVLALRLNNLGAAELAAKNPQTARQHFEQALAIIRSQEDSNRALMSEILRNYANAHLECDDLEKARRWLKEGLTRHRHYYGRNHAYVVECLNQLGIVFAKSERSHQALKSFHHAVNIGRELAGLDPNLLASCLANLGDALRKEGELDRAESCLDEALRLCRDSGGSNPGQIAKLLVRIGRTKRRRKQFSEAAALFEEAFALNAGSDSESTPAAFARQIGRTHMLDGNVPAALEWFKKARALFEAQGNPRDEDYVRLLVEIGEAALKQNDDAGAESVFRQAIELRERGAACPESYFAKTLSGLGEIEERRSNLEEAARYYGRARAIFRNAHGEEHPDVARQMTHMGRCLYRMGRGFEAVANIVYAERVLTEQLGSNHRDTRRARELLEQLRE